MEKWLMILDDISTGPNLLLKIGKRLVNYMMNI